MSSPPRVLIVEDEALIATDLEIVLEDAGIVVVGWATNGAEAKALAGEHCPDLALVDIQLKRGEDGLELAKELYACHGVRIVFLTAQSDPATVARAQTVTHHAYLTKPYSPSNLVAVVRQVVSSQA